MMYLLYLLSFWAGSIPFAYILFRVFRGEDIRRKGSGNVGATNVLRSGGFGLGAAVAILDISKAAIPTYICLHYYGQIPAAVCGLLAVVGHCFTPFLKFNGGKGVAAFVGSSIFVSPISLLVSIILFLSSALFTGIVSVGSLLLAISLPIFSWLFYHSLKLAAVQLLATAVIYYRHRENIKNILRRRERKIWKGLL